MDTATQATMFSSATGEHPTPQAFYDLLDAEFHFDLDAAATKENAKCPVYLTKEDNALAVDWLGYGKNIFVNPPYGRGIGAWVEKAYSTCQRGANVVMLLPARVDTKWFHRWIYGYAEVRFICGRLKFGDAKNSAPFPSMVVVFRGRQ